MLRLDISIGQYKIDVGTLVLLHIMYKYCRRHRDDKYRNKQTQQKSIGPNYLPLQMEKYSLLI